MRFALHWIRDHACSHKAKQNRAKSKTRGNLLVWEVWKQFSKVIKSWIFSKLSTLIWFTYLYTRIINPKDKDSVAQPASRSQTKFQIFKKKCRSDLSLQTNSSNFKASNPFLDVFWSYSNHSQVTKHPKS